MGNGQRKNSISARIEAMRAACQREPSLSTHTRRDAIASMLGVGGIAALTASGCLDEDPAVSMETLQQAASGTTIAWVDTVLGARPSLPPLPPVARTGDLATKTSTTVGATVVIARGCVNPGDGGGGLFVWSSTPLTDDGGTLIVPNADVGAVGPGWQRVFSGSVNVKWFGAHGGGNGSDSGPIQRAINSVSSNTGGSVFVPRGTYWVDRLTINFSNVELYGEGASSVLEKESESNALLTIGLANYVTVRDLQFSGELSAKDIFNGGYIGGWAIFCAENASWLRLENLKIFRTSYGIGLQPPKGKEVHNASIKNVVLDQVDIQNITLFNCIDTTLVDSGVFNIGFMGSGLGVGLQYDSGCDGLYATNFITTLGYPGIVLQDSNPAMATNGQPPRHAFFLNCASDGAWTAGWAIRNAERCHFTQCWAATQKTGASGFKIDAPSRKIELSNCIVLNNHSGGVVIGGATDVGIIGGEIIANRTAGVLIGAGSVGVRVIGVRSGTDPDFAFGQTFGVQVASGASNYIVSNCDLRGNAQAGLSNAGSAPSVTSGNL